MKTSPEILEILKFCLIKEQAISLIRYGDGEAMVLDGHRNPEVMARVFKRQFFQISYEDGLKVRNILMTALAGADILGLPFNKKQNEPESYWFKAQSILTETVPVLDKEVCHIDVHYHLQDDYPELFALAPRIFYISCRDLDKRLSEVSGKEVKSFRIPPEAAFTSYEGRPHYPDHFQKVEDWMDTQNIKGALCLVGGGVLGKVYCNWFRDRGGIAFDIGSMFDQWAGYVTRGPERARDKKTNENIL